MPNLTEFNRTEVIINLSNKLNLMNDQLQSTQKQHSETEIKLQSDIDSMRVKKAKIDQEIKIKEKQILENTSEIEKLKGAVEQVITIILWIYKINNP